MLSYKKFLSIFYFFTLFFSLSLAAVAARGPVYPSYDYLVVGGAGSTVTFTPVSPLPSGFDLQGIRSNDQSWFNVGANTKGVGTLTVEKNPDAEISHGWVAIEYKIGSAAYTDTIKLIQPMEKCIDPKKGSSGREFFVALMQNVDLNITKTNPAHFQLYATADTSTSFTVTSTQSGQQVAAGTLSEKVVQVIYEQKVTSSSTSLLDNLTFYNRNAEVVSSKSLYVKAEKPISLYAYSGVFQTSDASHVIPIDALGNEYFTVSWNANSGSLVGGYVQWPATSEMFMIIATEDDTYVTITPAMQTDGSVTGPANSSDDKPADIPFTIRLNRGQTYLVKSKELSPVAVSNPNNTTLSAKSLTGTHIKSSKPIAVFGGHQRAAMCEQGCGNRDHLYEQLLPLRSWGKRYALVRPADRSGGVYRIVAAGDGTSVTITDRRGVVKVLTLNRGEYATEYLHGDNAKYAYVEASQPVEVVLFSESMPCVSAAGIAQTIGSDPFMLTLCPIDAGTADVTFTPVKLVDETTGAGYGHYVTVIVETPYKNLTKLELCGAGNIKDDMPLTFIDMPNTRYSYAESSLVYNANKNYHLSNPYGFAAYAYSYAKVESTGFMLGGQYGAKGDDDPLAIDYCIGATPVPLPRCVDGSGSTPCPDGDNKYYWYKSLQDWQDGKELAAPPTFSTARDTIFHFYRSHKLDCGVSYPQGVLVTVWPPDEVTFKDTVICLSTHPDSTDYGATPKGGKYTLAGSGLPFTHTGAGEGEYSVTYTYTTKHGCVSSKTAKVKVETPRPVIFTASGVLAFCRGGKVILEVKDNNSSSLSGYNFQWYYSGVSIPFGGMGNTYYVEPGASAYDAGNYSVQIENARGCKATTATTVSIYDAPTPPKIAIRGDTKFCVGAAYTLYDSANVVKDGYYMWYKASPDPANELGNSTFRYEVPEGQETVSGDRRFVLGAVTPIPGKPNAEGCWSYGEIDLTIYPLANTPQILPTGATHAICEGDSLKLTASAVGESSYTYKWYSYGAGGKYPLLSSGKDIYVKEGEYSVKSISRYGCESKDESATAVVETRKSAGQPLVSIGAPVCAGGAITVSANAVTPGSGFTSYQWYAVGQNDDYTEINNATDQTYDVTVSGSYAVLAITRYDGGTATTRVTCPSPYSSVAAVTLYPKPLPPVITGSINVCLGSDVALEAAPAPGSAPVEKYQWYKDGDQLTTANVATLRIAQSKGAATYTVEAISSNGCRSDVGAKTVTVHKPTATIAGPPSRDTCYGNTVMLEATSNPATGITYEWYRSSTHLPDVSKTCLVSGSSAGTQTDSYHLYVTDTWGCRSEQSNTVTVIVYMSTTSLAITSAPTCTGNDLLLTSSVQNATTYDWFFEKDGARISKGRTTAGSLTIPKATPSDGGRYAVQIANSNGCISEGAGDAKVHMAPPKPEITPDTRHICLGDSARLIATAGESDVAYEWFFTSSGGTKVIPAPSGYRVFARQEGAYSARIKSNATGCWSGESDAVEIYTYRKPERPVIAPAADTVRVCVSSATMISATSSGATAFQWYAIDPNNHYTTLKDATLSGYAVKESGRYAVRAYISYGNADNLTCPSDSLSVPKVAMLFSLPSSPTISGNASACAGATIALAATADLTGPKIASYQWSKNGLPLNHTVSDTCYISQVEEAVYTVAAISVDACTSAVSVQKRVSIRNPRVEIDDSGIQPICFGGFITLTATTNTGLNSSYEWYKNDVLIPNANAISYVVRSEGSPTEDKAAVYHLYVVDEGGCRSSVPSNKVKVEIRGLPPTPVVTSPPPVCETGSVTLTATPSGAGTYQWYFERNGVPEAVGLASNDTSCRIPNVQIASAGRYSVKIANQWGCTSEGRGEVVVYASPQNPLMNIDDAVHLCTGDSVLLTAYTADGDHYEWYFGAGKLSLSGDRLYARMAGVYSAWSVSNRGCRSRGSDEVAVDIHRRPETPTISPDGRISVCANGYTTITGFASGATSYQWYSVDPGSGVNTIISGATGSSYDVGESGHYAVRADILHSGAGYRLSCPSTSLPKEVELFPILLPPVLTGDTTSTGGEKTVGCDGETLTLTAAVPGNPNVASYKWYKNGAEMTSVTAATYTVTQVEISEYKVEAISSKGCRSEASTSKEIAIRRRPTVSIADGVREVCGGTITLSAVTNPPASEIGGSYEWYENRQLIPSASTSPIYVVQGSGAATAGKKASCYLFVTDRYGCRSAAASNTVEVNIRELPPTPNAATDPDSGVCKGSSATLKVSPSGAGTYTWFKFKEGDFVAIAATSDTTYRIRSAQDADAGLYAVEITNTYGCKSAVRGEIGLTVRGLPVVNIIDTLACESWTEEWMKENTVTFAEPKGGWFSGSGCTNGKFIPANVHQGKAALTYTYTSANGCSNSDTKTIEIIRLPNTPIVIAEGPTAVCEDSVTVKLKANVAVIPGNEYASSYTYQWRRDGYDIPGENTAAYVATKAGLYDVKVCNKGLCWAAYPSDSLVVSVLPEPKSPVIAAQDPFFCPGSATALVVQQSEGGSFQWYKGNSKAMHKISGEINSVYNATEIGQYAVALFGKNHCWSEPSNFITVGEYPLPKLPEIVPSQANLYASLDYTLTVKAPQTGEEYGWYRNNLSLGVDGAAFPIYNLNGDDTGRYAVKAVNEHGCHIWSEPYVLAWADAQLFVPNIFTPNGDGINDYFQIIGLEDFVENKLEVLNKQGIVVFSQKNYRNEWAGNGLPNDIYYYTLELKREDGARSFLHGYLHLKQ